MCSQNIFTDEVHDFKNLETTGLLSHPVSTFKILEKAPLWK